MYLGLINKSISTNMDRQPVLVPTFSDRLFTITTLVMTKQILVQMSKVREKTQNLKAKD